MKNKFLAKKRKPEQSLQSRYDQDLTGAKFRILNEKLYTMTSEDAFDYFKDNTEDFEVYHKGFASQVEKWPANPNDLIIKSLKQKKYKNCVIADIGCGEGKLGSTLVPMGYKVFSFDLVSLNEYVTCADMKHLPLEKNTCDLAIFCLSLMNKNFVQFIAEANRILKKGGRLVVAEITSRILNFDKLIDEFKKCKFKMIKKVDLEGYFVILTFKKLKNLESKDLTDRLCSNNDTFSILKPCIYKKR